MKSLTIRGVDSTTYLGLQQLAKTNHRSMQELFKISRRREVGFAGGGHVSVAQDWRKRLKDRYWGDIAAEIRQDRER